MHDSFVWQNYEFKEQLLRGDYGDNYLLSDLGYLLQPYLMVSVVAKFGGPNPKNGFNQINAYWKG